MGFLSVLASVAAAAAATSRIRSSPYEHTTLQLLCDVDVVECAAGAAGVHRWLVLVYDRGIEGIGPHATRQKVYR